MRPNLFGLKTVLVMLLIVLLGFLPVLLAPDEERPTTQEILDRIGLAPHREGDSQSPR